MYLRVLYIYSLSIYLSIFSIINVIYSRHSVPIGTECIYIQYSIFSINI